jgi:hypothetical protein
MGWGLGVGLVRGGTGGAGGRGRAGQDEGNGGAPAVPLYDTNALPLPF